MITIDNYFPEIARLDLNSFPEAIRKGHELVLKVTNEGHSWEDYEQSANIKRTVDLYLSKLNEFLKTAKKKAPEKPKIKTEPQKARLFIDDASKKENPTPRQNEIND